MAYEGEYNLEVMDGADNYNNYLFGRLQKNITSNVCAVLDFGAGNGMFARKLQKNYPSIKVSALEPAENLHSFYADGALNLVSSLDKITDSSQDLIYSFNVFEHIENDLEYLKKLKEKLKSGGKLIIYVPAFPILFSVMDQEVGHWRRYTRKELISKVTAAGFKVNLCRYLDGAGWFASLAYKWSKPRSGRLNPKSVKFYDRWIMPLSIVWDYLTLGLLLGKNLWLEAEK